MTRVGVLNGTVVADYGVFAADLLLEGGQIKEISADGSEWRLDERIDAKDLFVLPGAVDVHTHFEDLETAHREDFTTGTMAAAAGGVTCVIEHPLTTPPTLTTELYRQKRELAESKVVVDFSLWGALTPESLGEMRGQHAEGARGFKAFLTDSETPFRPVNDAQLLEGMEVARELDTLVLVHAENDSIVQTLTRAIRAAGGKDIRAHHDARPPVAEEEAAARAILLARRSGVRLQVVHVSLPEVAEHVIAARALGLPVSMEVCPHHLLVDLDGAAKIGPNARCAPPIREREKVERLWQHASSGALDCLISDHSPYTVEEKERGWEDLFEAGLGCQVIQEMVPLVLSAWIHERSLSWPAFVRLSSTRPAQLAGLYPSKGTIRPGSDADLILVHPDRPWTIRAAEQQFSRSRWSPFEGFESRVSIERTLVRGETVFADQEIHVNPGYGQFLAPSGSQRT